MNRVWHEAHPMPRNPTEHERMEWHLEHARECGCRPIPQPLRDAMIARGLEIPTPAGKA
nr:hypothetical protein [uncultured Celeribacter sp.]